jgi:hypothetical protein
MLKVQKINLLKFVVSGSLGITANCQATNTPTGADIKLEEGYN